MIGYAMCGSFCTHKSSLAQLEALVARGFDVLPVMSETVYTTSTRFGEASELVRRVEEICSHKVIHTIVDAEPLGPAIELVITLASNDALSANMKNIAALLNRKCVYFVPMRQDDPEKKPHSLVADFSLLHPTLEMALEGKQYKKVFI